MILLSSIIRTITLVRITNDRHLEALKLLPKCAQKLRTKQNFINRLQVKTVNN